MNEGSSNVPSSNIGANVLYARQLAADPEARHGKAQIYIKTDGQLYFRLSVEAGGTIIPVSGLSPTEREAVLSIFRELPSSWQREVISTRATPPATPANENRYLISAVATDDWVGHEDEIAEWSTSLAAWIFSGPWDGWHVFDATARVVMRYDLVATAWEVGGALWEQVDDSGDQILRPNTNPDSLEVPDGLQYGTPGLRFKNSPDAGLSARVSGDYRYLDLMLSGGIAAYFFKNVSSGLRYFQLINGYKFFLDPGSAAEPSLSFGTDRDTGVYRPGPNMLGFACGGLTTIMLSNLSFLYYGTTITMNNSQTYDPETTDIGFKGRGAVGYESSLVQYRVPTLPERPYWAVKNYGAGGTPVMEDRINSSYRTTLPSVTEVASVPPTGYSSGDRAIVGVGGSGLFAGHDNEVAVWNGFSWDFYTPERWETYGDNNTSQLLVWNGTSWVISA